MSHDFQKDIDAVQRIPAVTAILDVVCRATGMGFAAVARVTEDRWIACQVLDNIHFGLPAGGELKVETTLCHEVRQHREVIVIDNVAEDPVYCDHHTPSTYGLQSYISMPIVLADGRFFGTLCAIDPKPARLNNPQILGTFSLFAELIAYHLDAEEKVASAEQRVTEGEAAAEIREQFIAVLGHDLRNPVASIDAGANVLLREGWTDRAPRIVRMMKASVVRMNGLIDNVLDLARSRLGGGIGLNVETDRPLQPTIEHVVYEIRAAHPDRDIRTSLDFEGPAPVDHARIAQLLSNLLTNAVVHGSENEPIRLQVGRDGNSLVLVVANGGSPIPPEVAERLFHPFYRGQINNNAQGLGLGLYIAAQIAEAHGGRIYTESHQGEIRFTFRMPLEPLRGMNERL